MRELQKYSERRTRGGIRDIPNGVYESMIYADDDGVTADPHLIKLKMTVLDEDIVLDFRGIGIAGGRTHQQSIHGHPRCERRTPSSTYSTQASLITMVPSGRST